MLNPAHVPSKPDTKTGRLISSKPLPERPSIHYGATAVERADDVKQARTMLKAAATRAYNNAKPVTHEYAPSEDATLVHRDGSPKRAKCIAERVEKSGYRVRASTKENYVSKGAARCAGGLTYHREAFAHPVAAKSDLCGREAIKARRKLKRLAKKVTKNGL